MLTAIIIYEIAWIALFIWLNNQSEKQLLNKIGVYGENILSVLFLPNILLFALWIRNWNCESNNISSHARI